MLTVESLSVEYDGRLAVDDVDLAVDDHEIVCVLGPSGSGKSTMLRAIAGLLPVGTGRVRWDGDDLTLVEPHRRGFGLMFQDHALFPHRDVLGNTGFGLRMQRLARRDVDARARAALDLVGLGGYEHRRVSELSGGEQQRVALARALAPEPRLLMLDEPLGALDRALREELVAELRALFARLGLTILFVTHDHDEAFALADRVLVLHRGRIEQIGTPAEVWNRPANEFVARFLGWNVTDALGPATIAFRPDGVRLDPAGSHHGTVVARTFRRDHFLVELRVGDAAPVQMAVSTRLRVPEVGDEVTVTVDPEASVTFGPLATCTESPHVLED